MIELFVLVLFLAVALVGISSCFGELSHLLESNAVRLRAFGNAAPSSAKAIPHDGGE
jgi:hypothetical protein